MTKALIMLMFTRIAASLKGGVEPPFFMPVSDFCNVILDTRVPEFSADCVI